MKTKILFVAATAAVFVLVSASCSSGNGDEDSVPGSAATTIPASTATSDAAAATTAAPDATSATVPAADVAAEPVSLKIPFTTANGSGTITISGGGSPVAVWFASQPGEVSLDLVDADIDGEVSVVEELVSFWFFRDDNSGNVPPSIFVSPSGEITDSVGTSYVVEAQPFPPAPGMETATTTTTAAVSEIPGTETETSVPENPENPATTTTVSGETTTTTTATSAVPVTTTTIEPEPPASLQVQVLNGSGVAGAAGALTGKLSQAGYIVLPADNAPRRYRSSAVYYAQGWEDEALEILETSEIDEVEHATPMPPEFAAEGAAKVIVLLGTDTATAAPQTSLRPDPDFDVKLPLGDDVPRDRYVPGLANIQIYTAQNENDPQVQPHIVQLSDWIRGISHHADEAITFGIFPEDRSTREGYLNLMQEIENELEWLGFTPQNVCGAPEGHSFTDLLQPTREWDEGFKTYGGDAIFTTDRLIELHGGERINPEDNLDFYIREAVQTAHDIWRISELIDETEAPQMILCVAWKLPSAELPEFANAYWYSLLTPGTQPQENLM